MKRVLTFFAFSLFTASAFAASAARPNIVLCMTDDQGVANAEVVAFKGIPNAAPPAGEWRWREPQPMAKWDGVRKADAFGASCPKLASTFAPPYTAEFCVTNPTSEDCLFLRPCDTHDDDYRRETGISRNRGERADGLLSRAVGEIDAPLPKQSRPHGPSYATHPHPAHRPAGRAAGRAARG